MPQALRLHYEAAAAQVISCAVDFSLEGKLLKDNFPSVKVSTDRCASFAFACQDKW